MGVTDELTALPAEVRDALNMVQGARIFVTSRERIKKPEGDDLFDESMATIRAELLRQHLASDMWKHAFINERAQSYRAGGMRIEQARIHAEADAAAGEAMCEKDGW